MAEHKRARRSSEDWVLSVESEQVPVIHVNVCHFSLPVWTGSEHHDGQNLETNMAAAQWLCRRRFFPNSPWFSFDEGSFYLCALPQSLKVFPSAVTCDDSSQLSVALGESAAHTSCWGCKYLRKLMEKIWRSTDSTGVPALPLRASFFLRCWLEID